MDRLPPRIRMPKLITGSQTYEIPVFGDENFPMFFDIDSLRQSISTSMSRLFHVNGFRMYTELGNRRIYHTYYTWEGVKTFLLYHGRIDLINDISRWARIQ